MKRVYCPNCDEYSKIEYHGHYQERLYFFCFHCEPDTNWDVPKDYYIPNHISITQISKYMTKSYKFTNNYWYT